MLVAPLLYLCLGNVGMTPGLRLAEDVLRKTPSGSEAQALAYLERSAKDMWARFTRNPARSDFGAAAFILLKTAGPPDLRGRTGLRFTLGSQSLFESVTQAKFGGLERDADRMFLAMCALAQDGLPGEPPGVMLEEGPINVLVDGKPRTLQRQKWAFNPLLEARIERLYRRMQERFPDSYYFRYAQAVYSPWKEGYDKVKVIVEEQPVLCAVPCVALMKMNAEYLGSQRLIAETETLQQELLRRHKWVSYLPLTFSLRVGAFSAEMRANYIAKPPGGVPGWPRAR